ncbi:ferric reductase like transmembrane component-domain-containing protein [Xylariaceae sp. FL1272]|nr:ferric reductase like transmembrane component-domain-containing protein [Xylariaceae sp. FL1272]
MHGTVFLLVSWLFGFGQLASATDAGIIGFGLSLWPDACGQACYYSLSPLYLTCTDFPNSTMSNDDSMGDDSDSMGDDSMGAMPTTSDECRASNKPWLESMAYCYKEHCTAIGYPVHDQEVSFSTLALAGGASPTLEESMPSTAPSVELASDALWLNETSLVNGDSYHTIYGSLEKFKRSEYLHTKYSVALLILTFGVCIACGIAVQAGVLFPRLAKKVQSMNPVSLLRRVLFLPALIGSRHLEPLPGQLGYVPSRMLSIALFVYIALNVVFSAVDFSIFQPNFFWTSAQYELCEYIGNRTGTLSLVNTVIAILFAGRNNPLIALTGWSQTTFMVLHRWAARVATVQAIVHSIVYTIAQYAPTYVGAAAYAAMVVQPYWWWGIIATVAYAVATVLAGLPFRARLYDTFLLLHIAFAILALVGLWYHLLPHFGFEFGYQVWLYVAFAFWGYDRLVRFFRIAYFNRLGSSKAMIYAIPECDVFQVTVHPRVAWKFGPGQHSFLYIPHIGTGKLWESHPFSIARWSSQGPSLAMTTKTVPPLENNQKANSTTVSSIAMVSPGATTNTSMVSYNGPSIQFLVRGHGGMTADLREQMSLYSHGGSLDLAVYHEGPYAGHTATLQPLLEADTVLCLIGGIGITHGLSFIQEFINVHTPAAESTPKSSKLMSKARRLIFAWTAKEMGLITHVKENFIVEFERIEYAFWCTGASNSPSAELKSSDDGLDLLEDSVVTSGRMNVETVIRASLEKCYQTAVVMCGPPGMADEARHHVIGCVRDGFQVNLIEEAFAW